MFDDLDDLLDDIPMNKTKQQTKPSAGITALGKAKNTKVDDDEFDWDEPTTSGQNQSKNAVSRI